MICPTCNKEIEDGVLVCEYCGQEFVYEEYEEEEEVVAEEAAVEEVAEEAAVEEVAEEAAVEEVAEEAAVEEVAEETVVEEVAEETVEEEAVEEAAVEEVTEEVAEEVAEAEAEVAVAPKKGLSIAAFVCAICGAAFALTPAGIVLSILALVFNYKYKAKGGEVTKMVKATKILGIIALAVSGAVFVIGLCSGSFLATTRWNDCEKFVRRFIDWVGDFFKLFRVFR